MEVLGALYGVTPEAYVELLRGCVDAAADVRDHVHEFAPLLGLPGDAGVRPGTAAAAADAVQDRITAIARDETVRRCSTAIACASLP